MHFLVLKFLEEIFRDLGVLGIGNTAGISDEQLQSLLLASDHDNKGEVKTHRRDSLGVGQHDVSSYQ